MQRMELSTRLLLKLILVLIKSLVWCPDLKKSLECIEHLNLTLGLPWKLVHLPVGMKLEILHNVQFSKTFWLAP